LDSPEYVNKKQMFSKMITIFGRKPVMEALQDVNVVAYRLHLSESNKSAEIIDNIVDTAKCRSVEVCYHDKSALSRISKNAKQDQGVALDIQCKLMSGVDEFLELGLARYQLIAVDSVTNPQNLGMIIRSVCASPAQGLLIPEKGCAKLDALIIKASVGTVFKSRLIRCKDLSEALNRFSKSGASIYGLEANASESLASFVPPAKTIYVMGNETAGLSAAVSKACTNKLSIPMCNGVESLNVAVAASLLAFRSVLVKER
jgi:23S rRNA (guanosine2251-2'-O)-methyltransferase